MSSRSGLLAASCLLLIHGLACDAFPGVHRHRGFDLRLRILHPLVEHPEEPLRLLVVGEQMLEDRFLLCADGKDARIINRTLISSSIMVCVIFYYCQVVQFLIVGSMEKRANGERQ